MVPPASQSNEPTVTSISLIVRIQSSDDVSWSRFVDLYSPLIWGWCRGAGLERNDADDVSQEVFTAVARAITRYERNGSFRGWLWQVTRNKVLDHFRARQRGPKVTGGSDFGNWLRQIPESPPDDSSVSTMGDPLAMRALELIRIEFEESTWTAFVQMVFEKRTAAEIAVDLGWASPDGLDSEKGAKRVRQAKFRIMKRLRDEFGEMLDLS
jgi:RNA polymerase sigma-70 factor (ECF subfamily)